MSENQVTKIPRDEKLSALDNVILFCLKNKLVVLLIVMAVVGWGMMVAPFDWDLGGLPRNPVPVDAIPDIGENQQIVFTGWMGRSPQDIEDQITYPLTVSLMGIPGIKTIRSSSMFGFSSIYVIFNEDIEFYWSRSRVLEKLNSLPSGTLPEGVQPALGPDATALGQVYWYTLEGRDPDGNPVGGWDLHELRSVQDWQVRYALLSADGVSEAASVGGFIQEYQIDVDPDAMRAHKVSLDNVIQAVRMSNVDVGARTIEVNNVEYVVRGLGFIKKVEDIEAAVVKVGDNVPIRIRDIAKVSLGPALRRGILDKEGAEAVGGVVVVRYGANPLAVIKSVKEKIAEITPGLPEKAVITDYDVDKTVIEEFAKTQGFAAYSGPTLNQQEWLKWLRIHPRDKWPEWMTISHLNIIPFYDRTGLIYETLGTLNTALLEEILVTIIVVLVLLVHFRTSVLVSSILPLSVLMCFIAMKLFGVDANIVALSGIAIAIGTMVDMGVIVCENILKHLERDDGKSDSLQVVFNATREIAGAVITAVSTTVISFLPVFTMTAAEGKLFKPLAFTKTFALVASVLSALIIIPPMAHVLLGHRKSSGWLMKAALGALIIAGICVWIWIEWWAGAIMIVLAIYNLLEKHIPPVLQRISFTVWNLVIAMVIGILLTVHWLPLGPGAGIMRNFALVAATLGGLLLFFILLQRFYGAILRWFLDHKLIYLVLPLVTVLFGLSTWLGFEKIFSFLPDSARQTKSWSLLARNFPGFGKEFMPPLDEGSYLYMPTTMPHASVSESLSVLQFQDRAIASIPEVESVVGKIGRVDSPLDPAPISMVETVVNYKPEYIVDKDGHRLNFQYDLETDTFAKDENGELVRDPEGHPYRQWRDHIKKPDDIWDELVVAAQLPGSTSAPRLQPIAARLVMLQTGMRAPMGVKVKGPTLEAIEGFGLQIEKLLKEVPGVEASAVFADRVVGKPYLEIEIDRDAISRHGLHVRKVQDVIETSIGGKRITTTVEGRERYPVRIRYMRELRDQIETLDRILVPAPDGSQIPMGQLASIKYVRGPQAIKSEDTFLISYVLFDKLPGYAEVDVVETCKQFLEEKITTGDLILPAGVSYKFAGNYENQLRSQKTLSIVLPVALFIIFMVLYFQFKSIPTTLLVFSGIIVAWAGGFILLWLYGQPWFMNFDLFGTSMRGLFQIHPINLSVAIWVGFLALFGIASDNGVVIATYLDQSFASHKITSIEEIREATLEGAIRRIRPCLMTTATTILALLPILTSTGRGSDVMVPMAIPSFGGMLVVLITVFMVPVLYCMIKEVQFVFAKKNGGEDGND